MWLPDWVYRFLPGDDKTQVLDAVYEELSTNGAATTVGGTIFTVPGKSVLLLHTATVRGTAGAAQIVTRLRLMVDPPAGTKRYNFVDRVVASAVAGPASADWAGTLIVPPGWKVRAECGFDAGAVANGTEGEITGIVIPRGNFSWSG